MTVLSEQFRDGEETLFCQGLRARLLEAKLEFTDFSSLFSAVTLTLGHSKTLERVRNSTARNHTRPGPLTWPVHQLPELLLALCCPAEVDAWVLVEFFKDVSGLEFMAAGKRSPFWAFHTPSLTTAAIVALNRRTGIQRKLNGFNGRNQLYNTEILFGQIIYELSRGFRDEIGKVLRQKNVARVCEYCHRLADVDRRKFCSDRCMRAARDARKAPKRQQ